MKISQIVSLILFLIAATATAQVTVGSITPVLIGSTGNFSSAGGMTISSSVGEPMVPTWSNSSYVITQGFQQPSANGTLSLNATYILSDVSCLNANDGTVSVTPIGGTAPYTFVWTSSVNDTLAFNDSLAPGTYSYTITDAAGLMITDSVLISDASGICGIHVYSGLTDNGDGHNDTWFIDYIDLFQPNLVTIYNRWGVQVWQGINYDNTSVVWKGKDQGGIDLKDGTYFYLIEIGQSTMKGWVELSH
jgi:gliding motility-associated-like protein